MYKSFGRRMAEGEIFEKLQRGYCSLALLKNPRIIDIVDQFEKLAINMYSPQASYIDDIEYTKCILPRIEMFIDNDNHFRVNKDGNVEISLPLLQEDFRGRQEKEKDIRYNILKDGMEKVSTLDYRRYGIDRIFKSIRYVYDKNGIETEREIEMLKRDAESVRTIYSFKERLENNPHILKITENSKPTKEKGNISYYDIRHSRHIEDLDETEGELIEEKDIKALKEKEKQEIIQRQINPIYRRGLKSLMGIDIEQGNR